MELRKSLFTTPQESFVEETPKLAGLGFRAKLGSPFFLQQAVLVWNSSHVMEANNQHRLGGNGYKCQEERCGGENTLKSHAAEDIPRLQVVWRLEEYSLQVLYVLSHSSLSLAVRDRILGQTDSWSSSVSFSFSSEHQEMNCHSLPNSKNRGQISQYI